MNGTLPDDEKRHVVIADYRYVFPVLDDSDDKQKSLTDLLATKNDSVNGNQKFIYTVDERRCSLVLSAKLEAAVRDGDVRDVMLAKDSDTVLLKLKQGKNVSLDVKDFDISQVDLWEGEGPTDEVILEREKEETISKKRKRKRAENLTSVKKIFEEKERVAMIEEESIANLEVKKTKVVEVKLSSPHPETKPTNEKFGGQDETSWNNFDDKHARALSNIYIPSGDWRDLVKPLIEEWDWATFDREAAAACGHPVTTTLPRPTPTRAEIVDLGLSFPGIIPQPGTATTDVAAFEPTIAISPFTPLLTEPSSDIQEAIKCINPDKLRSTECVKEIFNSSEENVTLLPNIEEIPDIVTKLDGGVEAEISDKQGRRVKGLMIDIAAAQRFVAGQTVETPCGPVFVAGQTIQTPLGKSFVPGLTVITPTGPMLLPGQKVVTETPDGTVTSVFVAGQTLTTRDGEKFVAGQTIQTPEGPRFVPGQTVITVEGPKFVPGQIVEHKTESGEMKSSFVPGQTIMTSEGTCFIPGQTTATPEGNTIFIPGQSVKAGESWEFVPGQTIKTPKGEPKFVAGRTVMTGTGPKFIPGHTVEGTSNFVPGITVEGENGSMAFIPGKTIETPQGPKFIEGQVLQTAKGSMFCPGKSKLADDGITVLEFAVAKSVQDVIVSDSLLEGMPISVSTAATIPINKTESVYGHMVQTSNGVEFFPGNTSGLPAGKRVPGKLIHGEGGEIRFVPGIVGQDDCKFIPGQVVMTDRGEQFVPGQVVETRDGPKFVPGQVVETKAGPKFVPGQTVDTQEGPRFVPGQIIETKAGPTFIPGQVISTDEKGSRFVPGQVVDTSDGPRFVPGRVVETAENVTFIPGQVVETKEGLRFVAPDLQDSPEGGFEFSVQGFEVSPEELKLLRPQIVTHASGEAAIDSRMLRQLSDAGMAVGRQVPADLPEVDVGADDGAQIVHEITEKLGVKGTSALKMADVLSSIARLSCEVLIRQQTSKSKINIENISEKILEGMKLDITGVIDEGNQTMREFVRSVISAVVITASHQMEITGDTAHDAVVTSIGPVFNELLKDVYDLQPGFKDKASEAFVNSLHKYLVSPGNVKTLRESAAQMLGAEAINKVDVLYDLLKETNETIVVDKVTAVLKAADKFGREEIMSDAFKNLMRGNSSLIARVLDNVSEGVGKVRTEKDASLVLQRAIVSAVRENSEVKLNEILCKDQDQDLRDMILQAVGLARALGMYEAASGLVAILSDSRTTQALSEDPMAIDVLKRLTVMRQLAERRPSFGRALAQLQSDPERARTDPTLRELVRESAALMVVPEETLPLESSADIPSALLLADNSLAMEEFMMARSRHGPLLILKEGLQAVVPREAARAVLTGQVPYSVLDETGIRRFEPLHVLSALRLPRPAAHRFSMYSVAVAEEHVSTMTPASSMEDLLDSKQQVPWRSLASSDTVTTTNSKRFYTAADDFTPTCRKLRPSGSFTSSIWSADDSTLSEVIKIF